MRSRLLPLLVLPLIAVSCGDEPSAGSEPESPASTAGADGGDPLPESEFVRHLQEELNHLGYHAGAVDGLWGPETMEAVRLFQQEEGISVTGEIDDATVQSLSEAATDADAVTVEALQQKLEELGFYDGLVDGAYGSATETAVRAYQEARELEPTGTLTHATIEAITAEHSVEVETEHLEAAQAQDIGGVATVTSESPAGADDGLLRQGSSGPEVEELQQRLIDLGYRPGDPDGRFGAATASAVLAFQKAEGLTRDGIAGPGVTTRLNDPRAGGPRSSEPGPRIEVDLDRQILFTIDDAGTVTTINVSTGSGREYETASGPALAYTPDGEFTIERSIDGLRKAELGTLYRPLYFKDGWAVHGNPNVPAYPASHGCVRTANWDQDFLWTVVSDGAPVSIYGHNPGDETTGAAGA